MYLRKDSQHLTDMSDHPSTPKHSTTIRPPLRSPTDQIRLLFIHAGEIDDEIHCSIISCQLDPAPEPYIAISYTWGDQQSQCQIFIDQQPFTVGPNCLYAIRQARECYPNQYLWIDYICINQDDLPEKSAQVAIMGSIYANAWKVLACIGPQDASSRFIQEVLLDLDNRIADLGREWYRATAQDGPDIWQKQPTSDEKLLELGNHWNEFEKRPYFHRLWVVQELFEGQGRITVQCGFSQMDWDRLVDLSRRMLASFSLFTSLGLGMHLHCSYYILTLSLILLADGCHIGQLFDRTCNLDCADPRDRLYGVLRLVNWDHLGVPKPIPDYNISAFQLFLDLTQQGHFFDIFYLRYAAVGFELHSQDLNTIGSHLDTAPTTVQSWITPISGACQVKRDVRGRLSADLKQSTYRRGYSPPSESELALIFSGDCPVKIFTGEEVSVLACPGILPGDILLESPHIQVVVRPLAQRSIFQVVGKVMFLNYQIKRHEYWGCGCSIQRDGDRETISVKIVFEATVRDMLGSVILGNKHEYGDPVFEVTKSTLGIMVPVIGSTVRDDTDKRHEGKTRTLKIQENCIIHDNQECRELSEPGLWFTAICNAGCYL